MKKVFVTGVTGFVGSHLVKGLLQNGNRVYGLVRTSSDISEIDERVKLCVYDGTIESIMSFFEKEHPDIVIHTAAACIYDCTKEQIDNLLDSNIRLAVHLMQVMVETGVKYLINTSTYWEHYDNEEYNPVCLYAATKKAVEDLLIFYTRTKKIKAITLTLYDSYGDNDKRGKIMSLFQKISQEETELDMTAGEQKIDLIHIDDVVKGYLQAIKILNEMPEDYHVYHLRTDVRLKLKEVADIYEHVKNVKLLINWGTRPYRLREIMVPYNGGEVLPGWQASIKLEDGIKRLK